MWLCSKLLGSKLDGDLARASLELGNGVVSQVNKSARGDSGSHLELWIGLLGVKLLDRLFARLGRNKDLFVGGRCPAPVGDRSGSRGG